MERGGGNMKVMVALKIAGWVLLGICVAAALSFVVAVPVMALWNWVMPVVSRGAVGELTYLQTVGLYMLCHILFKSHHEHLKRDEKERRQPRLLARRIHGLLGKGNSDDNPAGPD